MVQILDKQGLQHYANKMCNADNRKVGSKSLPTALNDIDTAIDGFKTLFETEYGTPINMELTNNQNIFTVGTSTDIDKKDDVENSFTDLKICGNTLVNLCPLQPNLIITRIKSEVFYPPMEANTTYTLITKISNSNYDAAFGAIICVNYPSLDTSFIAIGDSASESIINGYRIQKITTKSESVKSFAFAVHSNNTYIEENKFTLDYAIILEGDWTNKTLPQYFEGLKSIGEKEDGNHKISILSRGKNLFDTNLLCGAEILSKDLSSFIFQGWASHSISNSDVKKLFKPNTTYTIKAKAKIIKKVGTVPVFSYDVGGMFYHAEMTPDYFGRFRSKTMYNLGDEAILETTFTTPNCLDKYELRLYSNRYADENVAQYDIVEFSEIQLEESTTSSEFESYKSDKKEISLNEPLRGLPNGVKDTIEKINGEWKIVRRCGESILNGSEDWSLWSCYGSEIRDDRDVSGFGVKLPLAVSTASTKVICDNFATGGTVYNPNDDSKTNHTYYTKSRELIYCYYANAVTTQMLGISIKNSKLKLDSSNWNTTIALANFKNWLSQNPTKVIYQLDTPIIEDISPVTLQCWKNGTISIDEVLPVETTHTVALNKSAQIQKNIEELTVLRNRVKALEEQYDKTALNQAYEVELLRLDMQLDNII